MNNINKYKLYAIFELAHWHFNAIKQNVEKQDEFNGYRGNKSDRSEIKGETQNKNYLQMNGNKLF